MKVLTLTQPWATLVAIGAKSIETRSWSTSYCGLLAIHAAKGWSLDDQELVYEEPFEEYLAAAGYHQPGDLPRASVVAVCTLTGCCPTSVLKVEEPERSFGNFNKGRYGWFLADVVRLPEPIPAKGALGLWSPSVELLAQIEAGMLAAK